MTNQHGRPWEATDLLFMGWPTFAGSFVVMSSDGVPLYGRHVPGTEPQQWTAPAWSLDNPQHA